MQPQPLICVSDVEASSRFYGRLLLVQNVHGVANSRLQWFEPDDFDDAVARAAEMKAQVVRPRQRNPKGGRGGPNHWELWLLDPDGYTVVLASPDGTAGL
jgi:hypothetical protein